MRLTPILLAQHLGWTFKKHWQIKGKRIAKDTGVLNQLKKLGVVVNDPKEQLKSREQYSNYNFDVPEIEIPTRHKKVCHVYGNETVLLEGMKQAQVLTKTVEVRSLPKNLKESLSKTQFASSIDRNVQQIILASNLLDAQQVILEKRTSLDHPAYNFAREYGISLQRRNRLLVNRLLMECEKLASRTLTSRRRILDQTDLAVTLPKDEDLFQLKIRADKMIITTKPMDPIKENLEIELPDLYPIKCTISIPHKNVYTAATRFPLRNTSICSYPHTIFTFFNKGTVENIHGAEVSTTQFHSRNLLNAFAAAASRAKQLYGEAFSEDLPKPIVIQSIQTDGRIFHFGVLQLNSLALGEAGKIKNYWFHEPNMELYSQCGYKYGRPYLEGYNKNIFRYLNIFYNNV